MMLTLTSFSRRPQGNRMEMSKSFYFLNFEDAVARPESAKLSILTIASRQIAFTRRAYGTRASVDLKCVFCAFTIRLFAGEMVLIMKCMPQKVLRVTWTQIKMICNLIKFVCVVRTEHIFPSNYVHSKTRYCILNMGPWQKLRMIFHRVTAHHLASEWQIRAMYLRWFGTALNQLSNFHQKLSSASIRCPWTNWINTKSSHHY